MKKKRILKYILFSLKYIKLFFANKKAQIHFSRAQVYWLVMIIFHKKKSENEHGIGHICCTLSLVYVCIIQHIHRPHHEIF